MADDNDSTADLTALAAAAHGKLAPGEAAHWRTREAPRDEARESKIAELRAKYLAGDLSIDDQALAAKLIDSLFGDPPDING